jgi:hypothetical protein
MADTTFYVYTATAGSNDQYTISGPGAYDGSLPVVDMDISLGDQFAIDNVIYDYLGGADQGGQEVGFFAFDQATGQTVFFSDTPLNTTEPTGTFTLEPYQSDITCFMAGTRIATPSGPIQVEALVVGGLVTTADGTTSPIKWLGRQTVSTRFANPNRVLPIRIRAGAFDENLPERDLLVSPCHAIFVDGVLAQAGALVNGSTIVRESQVPKTFTYYHVELENHSLILAEGLPTETFVDNVDRLGFDNWDEHRALYPEGAAIKELPYPRASSARQVPRAIVRKLDARVWKAATPLQAAS